MLDPTHAQPGKQEPEGKPAARKPSGLGFYLRAPLLGLWFLFSSFIGLILVALKPGDPSHGRYFSQLNAFLALPILGLKVKVLQPERLRASQPCVFVTNHQANEDVFIHGSFYPGRTVVTGKRELIRIPIFGWMFKAMGNIMIDRSHHASAVHQLGEAAERVKREGLSVWIFPEGHRNNGPHLLPFKRGAFHLAVMAGVPVVPVATQRYGRWVDIAARRIVPGTMCVDILEPVSTEGMTEEDVPALTARVQQAIEDALDRMDREQC